MRKLRGGVKDCENGNGDERVEEGKRDREGGWEVLTEKENTKAVKN